MATPNSIAAESMVLGSILAIQELIANVYIAPLATKMMVHSTMTTLVQTSSDRKDSVMPLVELILGTATYLVSQFSLLTI